MAVKMSTAIALFSSLVAVFTSLLAVYAVRVSRKMQVEYRSIVKSQARIVHDVLREQSPSFNLPLMTTIPRDCGVSESDMAKYLEHEEVAAIRNSWDRLNNHLEKYWLDSRAHFKNTPPSASIENEVREELHELEKLFHAIAKE